MEEQVSAKIIELALAITARVVGAPTHLTPAAMTDLKHLLESRLTELNRICLHMHPDDVQGIEALRVADGVEWPSHPRIVIESDAMTPCGEPRVVDPAVPRQSFDGNVLSALAELLSSKTPPST